MSKPQVYKAIAAMAERRVIGAGGDLPWHLPEDFKWFKEATMGGILVMGRKTYQSIGKPLPGRDTYVLSRSLREIPDVHCFTRLEALDDLRTDRTIWIAGGAEIYSLMLPRCEELFLSRIHREVDGDTFFPSFEKDFTHVENIREREAFTVERWVRQSS